MERERFKQTMKALSATGRHEAYVARPELCVKPSKIP